MYRGSDSVFRLSLTGTVFIFVLFLLVVFGWMYADADMARTEALARLGKRQQEDALPQAREAFESARQALRAQLEVAGANADVVIRRLLDRSEAEVEVAALKARVQDLNAQLMGLSEIRKILTLADKSATLNGATEDALLSALELRARLVQKIRAASPVMSGRGAGRELTDNEIFSQALAALELRNQIEAQLEKELGQTLAPGQEAVWAEWLLRARLSPQQPPGGGNAGNAARPRAGGGGEINAAARQSAPAPQPAAAAAAVIAQPPPAGVDIASLNTRLGTQSNATVLPCWVDRAGNVQFLLSFELRPGNVLVSPAWPPEREAEARAIPGIGQLLGRGPLPYDLFSDRIRPIAQHGGSQCHYAVQVKDNMRDAMRSERVHQQLETLFNLSHSPR